MMRRAFIIVFLLAGTVMMSIRVTATPAAATKIDFKTFAQATPQQIKAFFCSEDYTKQRRTDGQFLNDVYHVVLQREPDVEGLQAWATMLKREVANREARNEVVHGFLNSAEFQARLAANSLRSGNVTRNPGNVVFDDTGVLVNDATALPADRYVPLFKKARIAWLALQIDNGGQVRKDNVSAIERGWMSAWRAAGFKVGFWGAPRGVSQHNNGTAVVESARDVEADAALAVKLTAQHRAEFYIADCEDSYQGYNQTDPTPELNRVYVNAFQRAATAAGIGNIPRALSSMGRVALDMRPWIENGWDAMPQAYWNSYAVYQPSKCIDFYVKEGGWPIGRVHPTIATYTGEGENRSVSLEDYAADLRTRPISSFSFYLPESYLGLNNDRAYEQLARMAASLKR